MIVLAFDAEPVVRGGKRVRRATFVRRSALPVSAACLVANSMRERLASMLATEVSLRLLEPHVPDARAWSAIARDALIFPVGGAHCEAAFVLRPYDALAVASGVFGESISDARKLSGLESGVLDRAIEALVNTLAPVCGSRAALLRAGSSGIGEYASYFEVLLEKPISARIGVAVSRDPDNRRGDCLRPADLFDVRLPLRVELGACSVDPAGFLELRPGFQIRLQRRAGEAAILRLNGRRVAHGEAGTYRGVNALLVRDSTGDGSG